MKNLKFTLILTLVIILAVVFPVYTFATDVNNEVSVDNTVSDSTNEDANSDTSTEEPTETEVSEETTNTDNTEETTEDGTSEEATEETTEDTTTDEESDSTPEIDVVGNYYESNPDIDFTKIVDGNIFLFGTNITISGIVNGDAVVIGDNVTLSEGAQILGNLFVISDNFTQSGTVYSLLAMTTNYTCEYDGMSSLDLRVFANTIKFSGYTTRSTYFYANNIELTDDAYIVGNLIYNENANLTIGENATVYGDQKADTLFSMLTSVDTSNLIVSHIVAVATLLGSVLFILLMITFFKPNTFSKDVKFKFTTFLKSLGVGILSFIVLTILSTILLLSTVFTTVGVIILMLFIIACMLAVPVTILTLASILYNKFNKNKSKLFILLYTILVALIYYALTLIPYAGFIITLISAASGLGLMTLWLFRVRKNNKVEKITEKVDSQKVLSEKTVKKEKVKKEPKKKDDNTKKDTDKKVDKNSVSKEDNKDEK